MEQIGATPQPSSTLPDRLLDQIIEGDSIHLLRSIPENSVHAIVSDIPYGIGAEDWDVLHDNTNSAYLGQSPAQEEAGSVFKSRGKPLNGWSQADRKIPRQYEEWCGAWAPDWLRIVKPGGSAFVFAGRRFAHRCVTALEDAGFTYKDSLAWLKPRATHRAQRLSVVYERRNDGDNAERWSGWRVGNLRPIYEPIHWFVKPYKVGATIADNVLEHEVGAYNEAAYTHFTGGPDNILRMGYESGELGHHAAQKPVALMQALIQLTTTEGQIVVDPFSGSGSTLVAAKRCNRRFVGYELSAKYCEVARERIARTYVELQLPFGTRIDPA